MSIIKLKSCDRWQVQGSYLGKREYLGLFKTRAEGEIAELNRKLELYSRAITAMRRRIHRLESETK